MGENEQAYVKLKNINKQIDWRSVNAILENERNKCISLLLKELKR